LTVERPNTYFKPNKRAAIREIYRLVVEGVCHQEIQRRLGLAEKTYYRYLNECFAQEKTLLSEGLSKDDVLMQVAIAQSRLTDLYRNLHGIATNENIEAEDRIQAEQVAGEVVGAILRILVEGNPTRIVREMVTNDVLPCSYGGNATGQISPNASSQKL
jgi:hypothetical protein